MPINEADHRLNAQVSKTLAVGLAISIGFMAAGMLLGASSIDLGRLFAFTNNSGDAGGGVWPENASLSAEVKTGGS